MASPFPSLPSEIAAFVDLVNRGDVDALCQLFREDALVNDQLRDHWGRPAIRAWIESDVVGAAMSLQVVSSVEHYGHVVVAAAVRGTFDMRGLPDPLVVSLYFFPSGGGIAQLFILPQQLERM